MPEEDVVEGGCIHFPDDPNSMCTICNPKPTSTPEPWETGVVAQFWGTCSNCGMTIHPGDMIVKFARMETRRLSCLMADNRPNRYIEGDKIIYRASTLGSCAKALVALGIGQTPVDFPDWLYERFEQGNVGEQVVIDDLRDCYRIMDQSEGHYLAWDDGQLYVEMTVGDRIIIRGHADGIGTCFKIYEYEHGQDAETLRTKRVIEVKCVTEEYGRDVLRELPSSWAWQISVYGQFYGLPAVLALGIKGEKGTENEGKVVNVVTELIDDLPYSVKDIKLRVIELERHIENGTYPNCDVKQWPCPFNWLCDDVVDAKGRGRTGDEELAGVLEQSLKIRGTG